MYQPWVPPGFVLLTEAFERFLDETDIRQEIRAELSDVGKDKIHTVEHASERIQDMILRSKMPEDIGGEIEKQFKKLDAKYVAVRSSATAEDSHSAAWAGQLDSFLNTTSKTLLENVQKCWASLFTPRAIFYRFEQGLKKSHVSVAVVIQRMIQSEVSGIAFSVHPVTEDKDGSYAFMGSGVFSRKLRLFLLKAALTRCFCRYFTYEPHKATYSTLQALILRKQYKKLLPPQIWVRTHKCV